MCEPVSAIMLGVSAIGVVSSIAGQVAGGIARGDAADAQSNALRAQAEYTKETHEINARMAEELAEDALKIGYEQALSAEGVLDQMVGKARTAFAAQGVQIVDGSDA